MRALPKYPQKDALRYRGYLQGILFVVLAACLAWQLLLPGFIGIADNGDFAKVSGWLCLAPRGTPTSFSYFQPDYTWSVRSFWDSPYRSSEVALGWVALHLANAAHEGARFDIRWLGGIHVALCLGAFAILLISLRRLPLWAQAVTAGVPVLLFTDVCYTAILNSFYMDAVAFCSLLLLTALAVWMTAAEEIRIAQLMLFFCAALLFVTSKTQHAIWAVFPAAFLVASSKRFSARRFRVLSWALAAVIAISGVSMVSAADRGYKGQAMFNVLFARIGAQGPAAMPDLVKLGVRPEEARYLGKHSYVADSPTADRVWSEEFYARTGFTRLLAWYLGHPAKTFRMVRDGMLWEAELMRQNNLGNYRVGDGRPPHARTRRFALWSDLRSRLFHRAPWYIPAWYILFAGGCGFVIARGHSRVLARMAWLALGVGLLGMGEFFASSLADCLEVSRHLFLFHACTDLTVCFAVAGASQRDVSQAMTLADLNLSDRASFIEALGWIFEDSPWVAERAWASRPFRTIDALHQAMTGQVAAASHEEQLALLLAHPDLGTRAPVSDASRDEQAGAGLQRLTSEDLSRLAAYREHFGFPFLFAVKSGTKEDMLRALEERSHHSPEAEFQEALRQVYRIARFRLDDALS